MSKKSETGINISKNTETVISIERKNLGILVNGFEQWIEAGENDPKPSISFADEDGVKTITFAYSDNEDDEDEEGEEDA